MQIQLNLFISVILEAVKAETYIKGAVDRSTSEGASALAYHETAGNEEVHDRKLMRGIYTSVDKLKGVMMDYLNNDVESGSVTSSINEEANTITFILTVPERFNTNITDSLARLFSKYIEDNTLIYWWGAVGNQSQVQFYTMLLADDASSISRMFIRRASKGVRIPYTSKIHLSGSSITMVLGEDITLSYILDEGVIDDVAVVRDNDNISIIREHDGFHIIANRVGESRIKLYSIHDEAVCNYLDISIEEEE